MLTLLFLFLALIVLALGALRRGSNSSDGVNSAEWSDDSAGMAFTKAVTRMISNPFEDFTFALNQSAWKADCLSATYSNR